MSVASHIASGDQAVAAVLPQSRCKSRSVIPPFDKVMALCAPCGARQRRTSLRKQADTSALWAKYARAREVLVRGRSCVASDW